MLLTVATALFLASSAPLAQAAAEGKLEAVRAALEAGAPVDATGDREWTALHLAAMGGHVAVAQLLLDRGANPNARAQYDMTPLHWASLAGKAEVISALAGRGANVEARNLYGMTPLHEAANEQVVAALAQAGAKLEQREHAGLTPLFTARSKEAGQALLARGADLHARAKDGRTLFDMLLVNTLEGSGLILYGRRSAGRLRGEQTRVELQVRNVSQEPIDQVEFVPRTEAATASTPPVLQRLAPAQLATVSFELRRKAAAPEEIYPLIVAVQVGGKTLGTFEMELDNSRGETPADQGMVRLGEARVKETSSRLYYLAFLIVPLAVLAVWLAKRRR